MCPFFTHMSQRQSCSGGRKSQTNVTDGVKPVKCEMEEDRLSKVYRDIFGKVLRAVMVR